MQSENKPKHFVSRWLGNSRYFWYLFFYPSWKDFFLLLNALMSSFVMALSITLCNCTGSIEAIFRPWISRRYGCHGWSWTSSASATREALHFHQGCQGSQSGCGLTQQQYMLWSVCTYNALDAHGLICFQKF
jgi:hypothetical protein